MIINASLFGGAFVFSYILCISLTELICGDMEKNIKVNLPLQKAALSAALCGTARTAHEYKPDLYACQESRR